MAAYSSSGVFRRMRRAMSVIKASYSSAGMAMRLRRSSRSSAARPSAMFSSLRSFLNQLRILLRASLVTTMFSQSRLGPLSCGPVSTSIISPVFTLWSMGTMRPSTLAPTMRLPTAEWMA